MVRYVDPTIWIESIVCKYKGFILSCKEMNFFFGVEFGKIFGFGY